MLANTKVYDYLTLSRSKLLEAARSLTHEQRRTPMDIGPGSVDTVLAHIMISEWYYTQRILGKDVPPYEEWPIKYEDPPPLEEIERAWDRIAKETRAALQNTTDWETRVEYRVHLDDGGVNIVSATKDEIAIQLAFHEIHHRAQALNMLRRLGAPCEDLDYNALLFERRSE